MRPREFVTLLGGTAVAWTLAARRGDGMKRRQFITLLGSAAALWPITADAQQPKTRVAGLVFSGSADGFAHLLVALRQGLREKGYVEGQNLTIEYRWADGDYDRLPALAADLVRRDVTLIISTGGIVAARAVKAATTEIPIVFASGDDPVRFGIVATMNHPGGNVTGVTIMSSALVPKRLEIVRELLPCLRRLGLMVNAKNPNAEANVKDAEAAARTIGEDPLVLRVEAAELDSAFREFVKQGVDTVLITTDPDFNSRREHVARLAVENGIALVSDFREYVDAGGLLSYGASIVDMYRRLGVYAGRILDGAKPDDLPVEQPTRFELILNLKTARALGLTIPPTLLARADEVIE
jgi:putative tryptophan/tyrosine transport system substrate-binding protein